MPGSRTSLHGVWQRGCTSLSRPAQLGREGGAQAGFAAHPARQRPRCRSGRLHAVAGMAHAQLQQHGSSAAGRSSSATAAQSSRIRRSALFTRVAANSGRSAGSRSKRRHKVWPPARHRHQGPEAFADGLDGWGSWVNSSDAATARPRGPERGVRKSRSASWPAGRARQGAARRPGSPRTKAVQRRIAPSGTVPFGPGRSAGPLPRRCRLAS